MEQLGNRGWLLKALELQLNIMIRCMRRRLCLIAPPPPRQGGGIAQQVSTAGCLVRTQWASTSPSDRANM